MAEMKRIHVIIGIVIIFLGFLGYIAMRLAMRDAENTVVKGLAEENKAENIPATIAKLKELRDSGAITEEDFECTKNKLLERMAGA